VAVPTKTRQSSSIERIPQLDGLRGIAIILVMLFHQTVMVVMTPFDRAATFLQSGGWMGVDLFFVLSGFLITRILIGSANSPRYFRNFYARRVLRIFPLYYLVLLAAFFLFPRLPFGELRRLKETVGDQLWYWTYLSNISIGIHHAFGNAILNVSWSLAIEEQFYLLWPWLVLALPRKYLIELCGCVIAGSLIWRTALVVAGASPITVYVLTPGRLDPIAVGSLVALLTQTSRGRAWLASRARWIGWTASVALALTVMLQGSFDLYGPAMQTIGYSAIAAGFGCLLAWSIALGQEGTKTFLNIGVLRIFGKYSYALYLFHFPILAVVRDRIYPPSHFLIIESSALPGQLVFYALCTVIALAAAWLSWNMFERHFLGLKRYFARAEVSTKLGTDPLEAGI